MNEKTIHIEDMTTLPGFADYKKEDADYLKFKIIRPEAIFHGSTALLIDEIGTLICASRTLSSAAMAVDSICYVMGHAGPIPVLMRKIMQELPGEEMRIPFRTFPQLKEGAPISEQPGIDDIPALYGRVVGEMEKLHPNNPTFTAVEAYLHVLKTDLDVLHKAALLAIMIMPDPPGKADE